MNSQYTVGGYNVFFRHNRIKDVGGQLSPLGGSTYAYIKDAQGKLLFGMFAFCSGKDHYNRKIGREVSFGRLCKVVEKHQRKGK